MWRLACQRDLVKERFAPSVFGRAWLTVRLRPSSSLPARAAIAALPSAALLICDKSKSARIARHAIGDNMHISHVSVRFIGWRRAMRGVPDNFEIIL
jgi:hypothetical protein